MSEAFVIHIHTARGATHYDLMLADGETLATWRLAENPAELALGASIRAQRISPHRRAYLDYEGPVRGGRGAVARLDKGTYDRLAAGETAWRVHMHGRRLRGAFELKRSEADLWTLHRLRDTDPT